MCNITEYDKTTMALCRYAMVGMCRYKFGCKYVHGDMCYMCNLQALHPTDVAQRLNHIKLCKQVQDSKTMVCGVCIEVVYEKPDKRFGILPNCNHCFCVSCIRTWRKTDQAGKKHCPQCRVLSNFYISSKYWIEDSSAKEKMIETFKRNMSKIPCRYFTNGYCLLGIDCFYKHDIDRLSSIRDHLLIWLTHGEL
ncbi:putative E3 ubiquitin-protein ligase makorin-1 [Scale drop disease virus]|uniref:ORF_109L n=1 Tax=Scale drop disease virus TaxID=1697349 RepID=A0A0K1L6L4_9VIRU|nr:ORF_109L [Scale drop disease virus]AKU37524.1 ORF_109L [Scale drop disease virus]QLI60781.1 putative E3 ubiquitin-protein ligase makorin-1 [Scale drop disease virus]QXJ13699.1 ORF109L [Scale drop disease virus]UNH60674.1 putative E3 ubiquitin-protein ligase makorin-1 [Scale drop disease virus]